MSNTITAVFKGGKLLHFREGSLNAKTPSLWQWDYGQILEIVGLPLPRTVEMHIARKDDMISRIGLTEDNVTRVALPDEYLTTSDPITVYIYLHTGEEDGETEYKIVLPIIPRPKPQDYDIADREVSVAYQALIDATTVMNADITTVTAMKNTTEQYMNMAGEKADSATSSATAATGSATEARSWAVGGTDTRSGEDTNNSKWWSDKAAESAAEVEAHLIRETDTQIGRVVSEGNNQVQRVGNAGTEAINDVESAGNDQIDDIEAAGLAQIQDISDARDSVVASVTEEGDRQSERVAGMESEVADRITSAGDRQVSRITQLGNTQFYAIGSLSSQEKLEIQNLGDRAKNSVSTLVTTAKTHADNAERYAEEAETALREINGIMAPPTVNGTYILKCIVSGGNVTYTWEVQS